MSAEEPRWRGMPVFRELHDQWWRARSGRVGKSSRPFSRDWETLLEDAGLVSAEARAEAERDVRQLQAAGWVAIQPPRFRPHLIERLLVPVAVEFRLATLFGDPLDEPGDGRDAASVVWEPELQFLRAGGVGSALEDWEKINRFLAEGGRTWPMVPVKERSAGLFGDEKRLDALLATAPFRDGRIGLETLRCRWVAEPLGWRRGAKVEGPVMVLENLATWDTYVRWDERNPQFSAVVYGKGLVFAEAVVGLADVFREVGGLRPVVYFGDLDPAGLEIPRRASRGALAAGWGPIVPHLESYRRLLDVGKGRESVWEGDSVSEEALAWLGDLAASARGLFARGCRLAQEHLGWEALVGD